jgi:hypothetical protein
MTPLPQAGEEKNICPHPLAGEVSSAQRMTERGRWLAVGMIEN